MGAETVRRYARLQVPRYTSYPTAAEFTADVSADDQARWIAEHAGERPVSLYIHVPYCRDICSYCGCNTKMAARDDVVAAYRKAVEVEIDLVAAAAQAPLRIARLHWGGGTPSILGAAGLASIIERMHARFKIADDAEHAIELDPRYVTPDLAHRLSDLGVNRASLGVQDIEPAVQIAIGRRQPMASVLGAIQSLRNAGIDRINFDLIYGLPYQTSTSLRRTCEAVSALDPGRIAYYGYAHVPQLRANQRLIDTAALPDVDARLAQAETIGDVFTRNGYCRIGLDHFAKPDDPLARAMVAGRLHRNFQGYTDDPESTLIGLGASSISTFAQGYVQNVSDVPGYVKAIAGGRLAGARGRTLSAEDRIRARIIECLMCDFTVDLDRIAPNADFTDELTRLRRMQTGGLIALTGRRVTATLPGRPLIRVIAATFDAYRQGEIERFSVAV